MSDSGRNLPTDRALTLFKPGRCPNPAGRPKLPQELQELQRVAKSYTSEFIIRVAAMSKEEVRSRMSDPELSMIEKAICSCFIRAGAGSVKHLNALLDRIIGPVPKHVKIEEGGNDAAPELPGANAEVITNALKKIQAEREIIEAEIVGGKDKA